MFDYNSSRTNIILKEYGRNIQQLVSQLASIEDQEERNRFAFTLVELMRQLNPAARETHETAQKVWDDLHIISNFELDLDSPYPKPDPSIIDKKPLRMEYPQSRMRYRHYGRNLERLIEEAIQKEDKEEREGAIIFLGKMMKNFAFVWNKDNTGNDIILKQIKELSKGKLTLDPELAATEGLFDIQQPSHQNRGNQGGGGRRGGRRYNQKRRRN
ncbi:MAG: DUF4290 domain-containing protein [Bacteroidota bacterium]